MKGGTLDIETFMGVYRSYANNLYEARIIEQSPVTLASYSYKEWGKNKYITKGVWEFDSYDEFVLSMWKIFDENDFLVGQNIKKFDMRQSNTFFAKQGLPSPSSCALYDTMLIARKNFNLPSYSLKYLLKFFEIGFKIETGGDSLWEKAEKGDLKARKAFLTYNKNDTQQTEKLMEFFIEKGYTEHPTKRFYSPGEGCLRCGKEDMQSRGDKPVKNGWVHEYFCKNCGKRNKTEPLRGY